MVQARLRKRTTTVIAAVSIGYLLLCALLAVGQRSLLYFPQPSSLGDRDTVVELPAGPVRVVMSVREHAGPDALLYLGGNGEDVTRSVGLLEAALPGSALYLLHYRSYGGSAGKPTEAALLSDALAAFDTAHRTHRSVTVIGRSLGTGLAVHVASLRPVSRLVLVTPYDSVQEIAAARFGFVPVRWLLVDKYESWRYAPLVTAPTLLLAAANDRVVPRASTEHLLARFQPGVAAMQVVANADHDSISDDPAYGAWLAGVTK